jgi:tetratricopeptide (TPR) repeat protein/transcriptional regulator with XRE-family HTH domain
VQKRSHAESNTRLRHYRRQHHWSQKELAQSLGTTYLTVCRWENGITSPSLYFRKQLCELFGASAEELGLPSSSLEEKPASASNAPSVATLPVWHVPYRRNPLFTGRLSLLARLHDLFCSSQTADLVADKGGQCRQQVYAISGLGGIGKTQTALEYAYRYRYDYQSILWVRAETRELLYSDLVSIAQILDLPEKGEKEQRRIIDAVKRWFATHSGWLLILDNIEDLRLIEEILPFDCQGHLLLTTHVQSTGGSVQRLDLEMMEPEEGALFLLRRAKLLDLDTPLHTSAYVGEATAIYQLLAGLPLALDQAGAYMEETGCSPADYLQRYQIGRTRLLARRGLLGGEHPESVQTTFALSFEQAEQANPAAAGILRLCAFLAPDAIPEELMMQGVSELDTPLQELIPDMFALDEALFTLRKYSLLRRDPETHMLTVHRLVQAVVRDLMDPQEQQQWAQCMVRVVNHTLPNVETTPWSLCSRFLPHAHWAAQLIQQEQILSLHAAQLLDHLGVYLNLRARPQEAEILYRRAHAIREQQVGPEHIEIATSFYKLGDFYTDQARYAQAEPLLQQALTLWEEKLGPDASEIAQTLDSLGKLYYYQGKFAQAESSLQRAVRLREKHLAVADKPLLANTVHTLALVYKTRGKLTQAESAFQQAWDIWEQQLGTDNPYTAIGMIDLASLYIDLNKDEQAETLLYQALSIQEKLLGRENLDVARSLLHLARLYQKQNQVEQAKSYYQQALDIREHILGPDSPLVSYCLHHLAELSMRQGRLSEAESLYLRALAIREQHLGLEHHSTRETQKSYAFLKKCMKDQAL